VLGAGGLEYLAWACATYDDARWAEWYADRAEDLVRIYTGTAGAEAVLTRLRTLTL
jgi:hypothetical protein